ncbi:hypothetical protein [Flexistipes sp.]|uniref:hypothetical protein n=1 Tax=Flexistipes sp. TaxID=3088135 RepID=UPI002E1AF826|nr:hypothetical protein [Flexistipes sp.]
MRKILIILMFLVLAKFSFGAETFFHLSDNLTVISALSNAISDSADLLDRTKAGYPLIFFLEVNKKIKNGFKVSVIKTNSYWKIKISGSTQQNIVYGVYSFLQDAAGFRFVHPEQTVIPRRILLENISYNKYPNFKNRGFHLHTLHPTELTEYLHAPWRAGAMEKIDNYLKWLVRNGQNVFQFYLLRTVNLEKWSDYAPELVERAHNYGVKAGIMTSFSMIQQNAFQFVTLFKNNYKRQIDEKLSMLFKSDWDFVSIDTTMGEFLPDLRVTHSDEIQYLIRKIERDYSSKVFLATHVIKDEKRILHDGNCNIMSDNTGILIHTVMCYALKDNYAPAYENKNFRFMYSKLLHYNRERDVWYWPESSYWVTFDNSIPNLFLPYLTSRWNDIMLLKGKDIAGHLTFSSGWEWGYWLIDWAVAKWSWTGNTENPGSEKINIFEFLFGKNLLSRLFGKSLDLQMEFLIDEKLLEYLPAAAPFSELPPPFNRGFQPRPVFTMKEILSMNTKNAANIAENKNIMMLKEFYKQAITLSSLIDREIDDIENKVLSDLADELNNALTVTALRAKFKYLLLTASAYKSLGNIKGYNAKMTEMSFVYQSALKLVKEQKRYYRFDGYISERFDSFTSYGFGYLYPVSNLFFWKREMEQLRREQFNAFFMNIWDFENILGLSSLF